jgi:hypothetical protein
LGFTTSSVRSSAFNGIVTVVDVAAAADVAVQVDEPGHNQLSPWSVTTARAGSAW